MTARPITQASRLSPPLRRGPKAALAILTLATPLLLSAPSVAQDAAACGNEAQRLAGGFPQLGSGGGAAIAPSQPGARIDAGMAGDERERTRSLIDQAQTAANSGDGAGCMRNLNEARAMLRQGGVGAPVSSGAAVGGQAAQGDASPNLQGDQAAPQDRKPDTAAPSPAAPSSGAPIGSEAGQTGGFRTDLPGNPANPAVPGAAGNGTPGSLNPQGAEAPRIVPPPQRNLRDSATPDGTAGSTSRGTTAPSGGTDGGGAAGSPSGGRSSPSGAGSGGAGGGSSGGGASGGGSSGGGGGGGGR